MATIDPVEFQTTRARSMPYRGVFYIATLWAILHISAVIGTIAAVVMFLVFHKQSKTNFFLYTIVFGVLFSIFTLIVSFFKRRGARCPLCRGTPLLNSGALAHKKSFCLPPFNHGYTAILSIVFTQKLSCMYCGTKFDLLKASSKSKASVYPRQNQS